MNKKTYQIDFKYAEIDNAPSFNAAVHRVVDAVVADFKREMPEQLEPEFSAGYLNGVYSAAMIENGIISVLLEWGEYQPGAAHPGRSWRARIMTAGLAACSPYPISSAPVSIT